jgi:hypothetical protein
MCAYETGLSVESLMTPLINTLLSTPSWAKAIAVINKKTLTKSLKAIMTALISKNNAETRDKMLIIVNSLKLEA